MQKFLSEEFINPKENISIQRCFSEGDFQVHTHDFIEIVYIQSGNSRHYVDGTEYHLERGDLLFINFKQTHSFKSEAPMTYINCLIKPEFLGSELIDSENAYETLALASFEDFKESIGNPMPKISFRGNGLIEAEAIIEHMLTEFNEKGIGYRSVLKGYVGVLLAKIFREMSRLDSSDIFQHVNKIAPDILKYIEEQCFQKITLKELARRSFYNPSYFSRVFRECYGMSLTEFIHEKRVNEAMRLLKETSLGIEEICGRVGYSEKKQFYKIFRKHMGVTPSKVRKAL